MQLTVATKNSLGVETFAGPHAPDFALVVAGAGAKRGELLCLIDEAGGRLSLAEAKAVYGGGNA
jgi:hypothetical protein